MADQNNDRENQEEPEECVNMLYLATTHGSNVNACELLQKRNQSELSPVGEPTSSAVNRPKGSNKVGDKQGLREPTPPFSVTVKPEQSRASPELSTSKARTARRQRRYKEPRSKPNRDSSSDSTESGRSNKSPETEVSEETENTAKEAKTGGSNELKKSKVAVREQPEVRIVERICPRVNCPEKIIICLDISHEMSKVTFRSRAGDKFAPIGLVKRALGIFLRTKHKLNRLHQFALVMLQNNAIWMCDFTNDPNKIVTLLEDVGLQPPGPVVLTESFDLASVFEEVKKKVEMPSVSDPALIPPPYVVRVILLYGRSNCLPTFSSREAEKLLQASPHFFFDAFYVHEPPSEENDAEKTFQLLCDLDAKGLSYVFEVSRNPTRLYDCMAQLLAHPLQRPLQRDAFYSIEMRPPELVQ